MDFGYTDKVKQLQERLNDFMAREIVPRDKEWHQLTEAGTFPPAFCEDIKAKAKADRAKAKRKRANARRRAKAAKQRAKDAREKCKKAVKASAKARTAWKKALAEFEKNSKSKRLKAAEKAANRAADLTRGDDLLQARFKLVGKANISSCNFDRKLLRTGFRSRPHN